MQRAFVRPLESLPMFTLPDLPYGYEALQPTMSSETLHLHHDKHHARYFTVTNEILKDKQRRRVARRTWWPGRGQAMARRSCSTMPPRPGTHTFFLEQHDAPDRAAPAGDLAKAITAAFGGLEGAGRPSSSRRAAPTSAPAGCGWRPTRPGALKIGAQTHDGENLPDQGPHLPAPGLRPVGARLLRRLQERPAPPSSKAWFDALPNWAFAAKPAGRRQGPGPGLDAPLRARPPLTPCR